MPERIFLTFAQDDAIFALPVTQVQEILEARPLAPLPRAPAHLAGLLDVRGRSVAVVDFRRLLGAEPRPDSPETRIVVLWLGSGDTETHGGSPSATTAEPEAEMTAPGAVTQTTAAQGLHGAQGGAVHQIALRVDRVIEVAALDSGAAEPLAERELLHWDERMVAGIGRREGRFVCVLRLEGVLDPAVITAAATREVAQA